MNNNELTKEIEKVLDKAIEEKNQNLVMRYSYLDNIEEYLEQKLNNKTINKNNIKYDFLFECKIMLAFKKENYSLLNIMFEDIPNYLIEYNFVEAIRKENIELINFLISKNVNIHQKVAGKNYLERAVENNKIKSTKVLIKASFNIHMDNDSAIRYAAQGGYIELCQYLIKNKADIHALNNYALRYSMQNNHNEIVKLLLKHGADINANDSQTFLFAATNKNKEMIQYLIENEAIIKEDFINRNSNIEEEIKLFINDYLLYHKANKNKIYLESVLKNNEKTDKKLKI